MQKNTLKIGEILLYSGKISKSQLMEALEEQKSTNKKLGEILLDKGWVDADDILQVLEMQLGFPKIDLAKYPINSDISKLLPESVMRKHKVLPIDIRDNKIVLAMEDPLNFYAIDDVRLYTKKEIEPVLATGNEIEELINKLYSRVVSQNIIDGFNEDNNLEFKEEESLDEEQAEVASAPIVRLINTIIEQAIRQNASDIHIEPSSDDIRVRLRVDGDLHEIMKLPKTSFSALITRVKIIGRMNIAERRIPQDGRVETKINNKEIDMRISTLPTIYGEKIVIRILDKSSFNFSKEGLGLSEHNLKMFDDILRQPYGMLLVTGPTGSGKTTTLYTVLRELNQIEKNIITVEDPVEYKLSGINQVQVNVKSGLTFASGLRSILRQDPDIIMVGEIRDNETAEIAVRAAITGHLVLSTLHTNDSPSTIARLIDMGIEPYIVSSAVIGVVSQRLVKLLCPICKESYIASETQKKMLNLDLNKEVILHKAVGCNSCNKGYKGRAAVHEIMPINEEIRRLIDSNVTTDEIREKAVANGMTTLLESATDIAIKGLTSYEEVMKVGFTLG
ncbi:type II/IV secretion system protein [Soehngenia longivitae]|uniref:Type II/IV secretion system protein n=1 Tax=Soehngenia longivitae TaxID=2562294 RepID=A0A4Z0D724_9FIRM|nr:GspE/PulE family protein [Soehngenia longivitae]TFZ40680.1 type II/IV secretion system protein [Soehngenia longivitae]